ncbi:MAG: DUF1684 domain-containing protein, partial [Proteobacteria bacterium]|nr:DUF1684 domain-containing protein [Pseudomonadota bacterium]MDA1311522.1 DUF1684 domain-containing protein [Pseudomonadota bacterium]
VDHNVHRNPGLGTWVLINGRWYNVGFRTKGLREALGGELTVFQIQGYGGGRYLIDAIKGADLGMASSRVVLDFNFSYHPSCRHSDAWICPLAPLENVLPTAFAPGSG